MYTEGSRRPVESEKESEDGGVDGRTLPHSPDRTKRPTSRGVPYGPTAPVLSVAGDRVSVAHRSSHDIYLFMSLPGQDRN